jgi:hypothetical protein
VDPLEVAISEPDPFPGKVLALIENNVQDLALILEVEKREIFNPRQSPAFWSAYDSGRDRDIAARHCSRELAEQFELASRWFAWRGNHELSNRYKERAKLVHEILSEQESERNG